MIPNPSSKTWGNHYPSLPAACPVLFKMCTMWHPKGDIVEQFWWELWEWVMQNKGKEVEGEEEKVEIERPMALLLAWRAFSASTRWQIAGTCKVMRVTGAVVAWVQQVHYAPLYVYVTILKACCSDMSNRSDNCIQHSILLEHSPMIWKATWHPGYSTSHERV
ncbi:uncharacterized protein LAESUDRAFT_718470 [Laetiporus sulphureus 93-53]|uniref:Uncharacterized protein n=1 Tax=Laetiporus sulphureus 93-53 TaxID=1314785 RepID=A0A165AXN3_9APHY|nr:uncharacterized protein LAESUDRAFT_718470 [Laetiporus sulphureus 93-53]KZS99854.1 hypothetical protein LAESUDRAFT_718470 [Laetiporus sulphureus 93-53]